MTTRRSQHVTIETEPDFPLIRAFLDFTLAAEEAAIVAIINASRHTPAEAQAIAKQRIAIAFAAEVDELYRRVDANEASPDDEDLFLRFTC